MATNTEPEGVPPTPGVGERRISVNGSNADDDASPLLNATSHDSEQDNATAFQTAPETNPKFDIDMALGDDDIPMGPRPQRRSSNIFSDTPKRRTMRRFAEEARAQSMGRAGHAAPLPDYDPALEEEDFTQEPRETGGLPIIDGRPVNLSARPREARDFGTPRLWNKLLRHQLSAEARFGI